MRIAINGFGRIGRALFRRLAATGRHKVVAINDLAPPQELAHFLQYDSFIGRWPEAVTLEGDHLLVAGARTLVCRQPEWCLLPWKALGVDLVLECSRAASSRTDVEGHIDAGAEKVLVTANFEVADAVLTPVAPEANFGGEARVLASGSCTTQCLAAVLRPLLDAGLRPTVDFLVAHQISADQALVDSVGRGLRRGRAATASIIPVSSTAVAGLERLLPDLAGRVTGSVVRVPTHAVSMISLTLLGTGCELGDVLSVLGSAVSERLRFNDVELVSIDFLGERASAVIDLPLSRSLGPDACVLTVWFDNEHGFVERVTESVDRLAEPAATC